MSDESDKLADIVPLHPGLDLEDEDRPVASDTVKPGAEWCPHRRARLNDENHRVYCRECDRELDAYAVLDRLAREPERWIAARRGAEQRAKFVQRRLEDLLRLERNAKARQRSRHKRDDGEAVQLLRALMRVLGGSPREGELRGVYADAYAYLQRVDHDRDEAEPADRRGILPDA